MSTVAGPKPDNLDTTTEFGSHLFQLVGEPFLFLRRSYGDELVLHFGERVVGPARNTRHGEFRYEHGTHSLHLRGSAWGVKAGGVPVVFSAGLQADLDQVFQEPTRQGNIETESPITCGARVIAVTPFPVELPTVKGIGVRVALSDGSSVVVVPTPDDQPETTPEGAVLDETADWELHTPHGTLQVGPGLKWHFTPRSN